MTFNSEMYTMFIIFEPPKNYHIVDPLIIKFFRGVVRGGEKRYDFVKR